VIILIEKVCLKKENKDIYVWGLGPFISQFFLEGRKNGVAGCAIR
jgi:hypothetical protein